MEGRCVSAADEAGRERLRRSAVRGEADRVRGAVVARGRDRRRDCGPAGRAGRAGAALVLRVPPRKRGAAHVGARDLRGGSAADRPLWTLARLAREIAARAGETVWSGHLSVVPRKGGTVGAGRATRSRGGGTPPRSTAADLGSGC